MTTLRLLLPYFRPYRRRVVAGLVTIAFSAALGLAAPLIIGDAIDAFQSQGSGRSLLVYAALLVGVTLLKGIFTFLQRVVLVTVSREIEVDLRDDYYAHLQRQHLGFFQASATGDLMARATSDLQAVRMLCGPAIMYAANTVLTGVGALVLMVRIHPPLTALALLPMPLVAVATQLIGQRIHRLYERVQEQMGALTARVQENLAGLRVVRALAREERETDAFEQLDHEYLAHQRRLIAWSSAFHPLLQALTGMGFVVVLLWGGRLVVEQTITIGQFVAFNFFLARLVWPMIAIGWVVNLWQRGAASLRRIRRVLDAAPAIVDPLPGARPVAPARGAIEVRGLTFGYGYGDGVPPALRGIDLSAPAGTTVAVVGRTGAGKSTLLALLPRLFDPPPGAVFLDGADVRELPLAALRSAVTVVPQETFLFSATVAENISFGRPDATREEVVEAMRQAGLEDDVEAFPAGLDTVVGERGITLSGGQKQRVALARALLRDPRVLLLDDCFSAIDTQTEERILRRLREVLSGRTTFLVSHRISTVRHADQIVVLDEGELRERGRHEELVAAGGLYAELHRLQQLEEELAVI